MSDLLSDTHPELGIIYIVLIFEAISCNWSNKDFAIDEASDAVL